MKRWPLTAAIPCVVSRVSLPAMVALIRLLAPPAMFPLFPLLFPLFVSSSQGRGGGVGGAAIGVDDSPQTLPRQFQVGAASAAVCRCSPLLMDCCGVGTPAAAAAAVLWAAIRGGKGLQSQQPWQHRQPQQGPMAPQQQRSSGIGSGSTPRSEEAKPKARRRTTQQVKHQSLAAHPRSATAVPAAPCRPLPWWTCWRGIPISRAALPLGLAWKLTFKAPSPPSIPAWLRLLLIMNAGFQ